MNKTYYVTRVAGQVRRLDDFFLPWIDVSNAHPDGFLDVMSVPNDPEKVIVIGKKNGIYWSNDSGTTWTAALGTYATDTLGSEYNEIWIVDDVTSYIAAGGGGHVLKSTDGGVTFNVLPAHPTPGGGPDGDTSSTAIHFITDQIGIVAVALGAQTSLWKTIDGGISWTQLNGGFVFGLSGAGGVHLSTDEQTIVVQTSHGVWRSTDAGTSFVQTLDLTSSVPSGSGLHLTWVDDSTFWVSGIGNTLNQSTDGGLTWTTIRNYDPVAQSIHGAHFYSNLEGFFGEGNSIVFSNDAGFTDTTSEILVPPLAIWTGSGEAQPVDPCYTLTDCAGIADPISTGTDLSGNIEQVITLADENGNEIEGCWFVTENSKPCDADTAVNVTVYRCYSDCDSCLPTPEPIRVAKPRVVLPNYTTGDCDPAIVEKAFCNHAEMIYRKVMARRFKLKNCCPKDDIAVEMQYLKIKHKLIEGKNPTPDPCNPMCMAFEGTIQPGYSATISYTDCNEEKQVDTLELTDTIQMISVCALNTNPPLVTLFDSESNEVDSFTLFSVEDCEA